MSTLRRHPVSRPKVVAGLLAALIVLSGLIALGEWLRPGEPLSPTAPRTDSDPRVEVRCEAPPAREGLRPRARGDQRPVEVTSADLYDCPSTWDDRRVRFTGEVVGAILQRGGFAWLQVNDDHYSTELGPLPSHRDFRGGNGGVGVAVPIDQVPEIDRVGGPRVRGDVVELTGVYRRVDRETREVAVIRADTLRVLRPGSDVPDPVDGARVAVGGGLAVTALVLLGLQWRARRRR